MLCLVGQTQKQILPHRDRHVLPGAVSLARLELTSARRFSIARFHGAVLASAYNRPMTDITPRLNSFRECVRHLWNSHFLPSVDDAGPKGLADLRLVLAQRPGSACALAPKYDVHRTTRAHWPLELAAMRAVVASVLGTAQCEAARR